MTRLAALPARLAPAVLAVAMVAGCGGARGRPHSAGDMSGYTARLDGGGYAILPPRYDPSRRYPVLVLLPASNGTAEAMRRDYPEPGQLIVILAAGTGDPSDYATNRRWGETIARYERQLRADVTQLIGSGRADPERVFLAGFSMGGDLAWALALRNPALVRGAVIMGSRMSYRGDAAAHAELARRRARFAIVMGEREDRTRAAGARAGASLLNSLGIAHDYREVDNLAHLRPPAEVFSGALRFVLGE
jgi:predicted esterase